MLAAVALTGFGPAVGTASAATPTGPDQITGNGDTSSAVTASWSQGLLGADNTSVVAPRDPNSPLSFMAPEFQHIKVTVGQTENLVHQAIDVTWSGFNSPPDSAGAGADFFQVMQCWGDDNTGPSPENCEFGTPANLLPTPLGAVAAVAGGREGSTCDAGSTPSTTNPPDGSTGCDPLETDPAHQEVGAPGSFYVPFHPAGNDQIIGPVPGGTGQLSQFFSQLNTNEVQYAPTNADGTGQLFFEALTGTQASGLGCGDVVAGGQARDCWLVLVPRGQFNANGFPLTGAGPLGWPRESPLGASAWAQRIQIHLGFAPIASNCPIGSVDETQTVGTELVEHAMFSWQLALNAAADCKVVYGYAINPESEVTQQLSASDNAAGLGFTTIPIGSEIARGQGPPGQKPPAVVYAPVAVSAMTLGFNINLPSTGGEDLTPIKLTPRLLAKALTQTYKWDLPDFFPSDGAQGPAWAQQNPLSIVQDPEFEKLNPQVSFGGVAGSLAPLLTVDHSAVNQQVWQWILADPAAKKWLAGTPDENGITPDPEYHNSVLNVSTSLQDSYPRADTTKFSEGKSPASGKDELRGSLDLLPYVNNLQDGASRVRAGSDPLTPGWSDANIAPDTSSGWWNSATLEGPGSQMMWAITDSADLADYGLVPAQLCDADGQNCVSPTTASLTAALASAKPDSSGLLQVNPATVGKGAYPLVDVTYAAVRANQPTATLHNYADLIAFAAGQGQDPGVDPGQLPGGYLPLPTSLRQQAMCAVTVLNGGQCGPGHPSGNTPPGGLNSSLPPGGGVPLADTSGANLAGGGNTSPAVAKGKPGSASTAQLPATLTRATPAQLPGAVRWVLVVVMIVGAAGALGGGLLRWTNLWPALAGRLRR